MKKTLLAFALLLCSVLGLSANPTVTLTVSGQGATKEEATANALRSAIEQAYGVFVSANTTILNDELIKDEIATVASGNIEDFQEISCVVTSEGETFVTLSATVAISKLQAYAKSKGSSTEFAGATFAMNMKMRELNKQNEQKALVNMYYQLQELAPNVFDWELIIGDPTIQEDKNYKVPMTLTAKPNDASEAFYNILTNTLKSLSLTPTEIEEYKQVGLETFEMKIPQRDQGDLRVVLRNDPQKIMEYLGYLADRIRLSYRIKPLTASGQTFYAKTEKHDIVRDVRRYVNPWPLLYKATDFYAFKKNSNSNVVMKADVFVGQDDMMTLQGFEAAHTPVNRTTFKYDNGELWASDVVVYQNITNSEFNVDSYSRGLWDKLDNITIADGVSEIGVCAFQGLRKSNVSSIELPNSIIEIGNMAFLEAPGLTSPIPENVTSIGNEAFKYFSEVYCKPTTPPAIGYRTFYNPYTYITIYVPLESVEAYKAASGWREYADNIVGYDFTGSDKTEEPVEELAEEQPTTITLSDFANEYMAPMIAEFIAKDEFETIAMHAQRVTEESVAALKEKLTEEAKVEYLKKYGNIDDFQLELGWYNAENETFSISIKNNKGELSVGVPLYIARKFKSLWDSCSKTATFCVENDVVAIESITICLPDGSQFVATKK